MEKGRQLHRIAPIFDENSTVLILGSFPSVKSREQQFYYGHPQNRFWRVLGAVFAEEVPTEIEEKRQFLLRHAVALWDVIAGCDIAGSSDSSIQNVIPNDLETILARAPIGAIYANGGKAYALYRQYLREKTGREIFLLPSTSPANAAYSLARLVEKWEKIREK